MSSGRPIRNIGVCRTTIWLTSAGMAAVIFEGKTRRDGVHGDVLLRKVFGHHPREVKHPAFEAAYE
jgi:hypothetical protein